MCAAISEKGVSTHVPHTQLLLALLNTLHRDVIPEHERGLVRPDLSNVVIVWDFAEPTVREWFAAHGRITKEFLPPHSPSLNPINVFLSA